MVLVATTLTLVEPASGANVLISGNDISGPQQESVLVALGHNVTSVPPSDFGAMNLTGFDAVWLDGFSLYSPGTPGNPGLSSANLIAFLNAGGNVLVENPGFGSEPMSAYPFGTELANTYTIPPGENAVRLVEPGHPLFTGVTSDGLSGWNPSSAGHLADSGGSFTGLADNGTDGQWVTMFRPVGAGNLVYTDQPLGLRISSGSSLGSSEVAFLHNAITIPEPSALSLLAMSLGFLVAYGWTRKRFVPTHA